MAAAEDKTAPSCSEPLQELESPFLDRPFDAGQRANEWQTSLGVLEAETDFLSAFDQRLEHAGGWEMKRAEEFDGELVYPHEPESSGAMEVEEAGIIDGENRVRVKDTTLVPWRWICKIDVADSRGRPAGSGTGVLISNKHILTAAHVVYAAYKNMQLYTITVIPALNDLDEPFDRYLLDGKPKIRQEYNPGADDSLDWDYALLTLGMSAGAKEFKAINNKALCYWASPRCGANTAFARLDPRTLNGKAAYTAGYPGGKGGKQLWCASGILHSANERRRTMSTTADTTKGQSGSPVWIIDNKKHSVVGIAVGAGTNSNRVVRVTRELVRQLRKWITESGEKPTIVETEQAFEPPVFLSPQSEDGPHPFGETELDHPSRSEAEDTSSHSIAEAGELEAEGFTGAEYETEAETDAPKLGRFDPALVPKDVREAVDKKDWPLALRLAIEAGWRDENELTNLIFFARHPELAPGPLKPGTPDFKKLSAEWSKIRDTEVWKAIEIASENTDLVVSGKEVSDHHRSFFRGKLGLRMKKLVEDAAKQVDLNPGLLGTIMMAETRSPLSYLSSGKVSTYFIGIDDFFEAQSAIQARVPVNAKVKWDRKQKPVEHLNDAQSNPRNVKTVFLDSGRDAALATAVYAKFYEVRLREIAQKDLKKDFDSLPLPTRMALTRMAMAAGAAGATPYLKDALNNVDIFVRQAMPVRIYQTKRNATVRTAQAMHLSDWVFGIPVEAATPPATPELESWDEEEQQDFYSVEPNLEEETEDLEDVEFEEEWVEAEEEDESSSSVVIQHDVSGPATLVVVGQRVVIDLTQLPYAANIAKVKWTVPGKFVGGYEGTVDQARLTELTGGDLEKPKISFFWIDAGKGRTVRAASRLKSGEEREFVAAFDVEGPKMNLFTGQVGLTQIERQHGTLGMRFGKLFEAPGIKWKWKVTMPAHFAGFVKDVQTVLVDRTRIQLLDPGKKDNRTLVRRHPSKPTPHLQLDGDSENEPIYTPGLAAEKTEAGKSTDSGDRGISDSPFTDLSLLDKAVSVNDKLTYYIMFKPATAKPQDAIWVPVAKATWSWKATAEQRIKKWGLRKLPKMKPDIHMTTTDFPLYQTNVSGNEWQEPSAPPSRELPSWELEEPDESNEGSSRLLETEDYEEPLAEQFVPKISQSDLRKRIDEYFEFANSEYALPDGSKVRARSQFRIASVGSPERDAENLQQLFEKKFGAKFARPLHTVFRCAAYGRARPDEIKMITQHLIDAGELDVVRKENSGLSDQQAIRALQQKFNIGIDCGGYAQLAFIYAFTGKHDEPRCNLASSKLREGLGLKPKRSDENLAFLPAEQFTEVGFLNGRTGDLLVLAWRKGERDWHTVMVVDHTVSNDVHTFLVDASWGFLYGDDAAGIARRRLMFDESTGKWWDIHPITGADVNQNTIGPYKGHPIRGMYRAQEK